MCKKFFIFPCHTWGKWKDVMKGQISLFGLGSWPAIIQERECSVCGVKERREVH